MKDLKQNRWALAGLIILAIIAWGALRSLLFVFTNLGSFEGMVKIINIAYALLRIIAIVYIFVSAFRSDYEKAYKGSLILGGLFVADWLVRMAFANMISKSPIAVLEYVSVIIAFMLAKNESKTNSLTDKNEALVNNVDELEKLFNRYKAGEITEEEYQKQKEKLV